MPQTHSQDHGHGPTVHVRATTPQGALDLPATLIAAGADARSSYTSQRGQPGTHLLLGGDRDYYVVLRTPHGPPGSPERTRILALLGQAVLAQFPGRSPVRRKVVELSIADGVAVAPVAPQPQPAPPPAAVIDLMAGTRGAAPLYLHADGALSNQADGPAPEGMACLPVLTTAARWISARRTSTFECLFPPSAFHPDQPVRKERLTAAQAERLLAQVKGALSAAAVGGQAAREGELSAAQLRSAGLTVLSHIVATVRKDAAFRKAADEAAAAIFELIDKEQGAAGGRPALRSHAIQLLQIRGPALGDADRKRAAGLLKTLLRQAPPYDELKDTWRFAMCSAWDFHEGECEILVRKYGFKDIAVPADAPKPPGYGQGYRVLEAPFRSPQGKPIHVYARSASPRDENYEMGIASFVGVTINRHAQLGAFDMQASVTEVRQAGYKIMLNSQCAGLTTRFAIAKIFPEADIYSSWDSTYFRTEPGTSKVSASEGLDCFVAMLTGMSRKESHAEISERMRAVQWFHEQAQRSPSFCQFIGPAHPLVVTRYADVNQDGHADFYDGFLDFTLKEIKSDLESSAAPKDPGAAATQIGGDAATGLNWAAGSLNRVTQYSDLWRGLPGALFYVFAAGGFYSHREPPLDVPVKKDDLSIELGRLPAVVRYSEGQEGGDKPPLSADVMFHSYLAHAAWELKRLLCAAEAQRRALDLGYLPATGVLATALGQRGALLLMLAGLLEFPADQNFIDGLWSLGLRMLNLPPISRSVVRGCITQQDHDASNYYGSVRGLKQLVGDGTKQNVGDLGRADPVAYEKLASQDATIGRAVPLTLPE